MCHPGSQVFRKGYDPNPPCCILLLDPAVYQELQRLENPSEEPDFISPSYHLSLLVTFSLCRSGFVCDSSFKSYVRFSVTSSMVELPLRQYRRFQGFPPKFPLLVGEDEIEAIDQNVMVYSHVEGNPVVEVGE